MKAYLFLWLIVIASAMTIILSLFRKNRNSAVSQPKNSTHLAGAVTICHSCGSSIIHQRGSSVIYFTCDRCKSRGHADVGYRSDCPKCSFLDRMNHLSGYP